MVTIITPGGGPRVVEIPVPTLMVALTLPHISPRTYYTESSNEG